MNNLLSPYLLLSLWPSIAFAALHDRGGGLIYDDVLEVTWLQDANYAMTSGYVPDGRIPWPDAMEWVAGLSYYDAVRGVTYDDWRLPSVEPVNSITFNNLVRYDGTSDAGWNITSPVSELSYMYYVNLGNPALYTPQGATGCYVGGDVTCLENTGSFVNLLPGYFWTETVYVHDTSQAWVFIMTYGMQGAAYKVHANNQFYAWAVRDGDVAAVPEPAVYTMLLSGLGLVGVATWRQRRVTQGRLNNQVQHLDKVLRWKRPTSN